VIGFARLEELLQTHNHVVDAESAARIRIDDDRGHPLCPWGRQLEPHDDAVTKPGAERRKEHPVSWRDPTPISAGAATDGADQSHIPRGNRRARRATAGPYRARRDPNAGPIVENER